MDIVEASLRAEFQSRSELSERSPEAKVGSSSRLIERLFARFAAVYGAKFANAWAGADPEEMKRAWTERLSGYDPHQVGRALELCETSVKHPPTLPEFVDLVRSCHQPTYVAIGYVTTAPPPRPEAELIASREYHKPASGFGVFWACQIVRLAQLGAYNHSGPLQSAMKVLGIKNIDELAAKYLPHVDTEREAIQTESA